MLLGGENTSTDCSPAPTTWQLDHPRVSKLSERRYHGNCGVFYSLALKVLHCHFHDIPLVTQVSPVPRGWDHCGLSWRLAEGRIFFLNHRCLCPSNGESDNTNSFSKLRHEVQYTGDQFLVQGEKPYTLG